MKKILTAACLLMLLFSCTANAGTVKEELLHRGITYSVEVEWPAYSTFDLTVGVRELQYDEEINEMEYQLSYYAQQDREDFGQTFSFGYPCTKSQNRTLRIGDKTIKVVGKQQTAHLFNDWQYLNEEQHIHWCQNGFCISKEKAAHFGGTATCTDRAVCEGCGVEYGEIDSNNHLWSEVYNSNGDGTHSQICERDNEHKNTTKIACSGGMATCTKKAVCTECCAEYGAVDENNHVNEVILPAVAPTETECGWTEGLKCGDCGEIIIPQQMIPVLPKTGDGTNLALLAVLAAAGMIGMTVILRRKKA